MAKVANQKITCKYVKSKSIVLKSFHMCKVPFHYIE